ncbi:Nn.00g097200.m01.CDS01 [Neocucurbitaria sp. VM-36]
MTETSHTVNRAIQYAEPGTTKTELAELPVEQPGPGQVLIRLLYSGVCHTDYGFCTLGFKNLPIPTPKGQIGGHEGVGEIIALGQGVQTPAIGTRVGIKYAADACLSCNNCLEGGETSCSFTKVSGYLTPGTFQQYCLSAARYVTPIPEGLDLAGAAPLMCGGVTVYAALKRAALRNGDWVVVTGAGGGIGHLGIQYAKALGTRVLALDASSKKNLCIELGADEFVDFSAYETSENLISTVKELTGGGARLVLMCSSSNKAYAQAIPMLGFRGSLCCLGVPEGENVPIAGAKVTAMIDLELSIFAIKTGNRAEAKEALEIAARGLVKSHFQLRRMEDLTTIFDEMERGQINGRVVIDLR